MTFDEMINLYDKIDRVEFSLDDWYPTVEDIEKYVLPDPDRYMDFLIWITENPPMDMTPERKEVEKIMKKLLTDMIVITEDTPKRKRRKRKAENE